MTRWTAALLLVPLFHPSLHPRARSSPLGVQPPSVRVVISDSLGNRVPFAVVQVDSRTRRAASDSGVVLLELAAADSIKLSIRRIGFAPFDGWAKRTADGAAYDVRLAVLPQTLRAVQVRAPSENRLFRAGFYERMEGSFRITARSLFMTPEELELRNADRVTSLLQGVDFLRITRVRTGSGSASYDVANVVRGRGRCTANILLDGQIPPGIVEEVMAEEMRGTSFVGSNHARPTGGPVIPLDQVVLPGSIAGIEVYQMASGAPVELRVKVKRPTCPLIAIWTGARR